MSEDRIIEIKDMRNTKDCLDLFCDLIMKKPNTMATVSGRSHRKVSITSFSFEEAKATHKQLGELLDKVDDDRLGNSPEVPNEPEDTPEKSETKDFSPVTEKK